MITMVTLFDILVIITITVRRRIIIGVIHLTEEDNNQLKTRKM